MTGISRGGKRKPVPVWRVPVRHNARKHAKVKMPQLQPDSTALMEVDRAIFEGKVGKHLEFLGNKKLFVGPQLIRKAIDFLGTRAHSARILLDVEFGLKGGKTLTTDEIKALSEARAKRYKSLAEQLEKDNGGIAAFEKLLKQFKPGKQ